MQHCSRIKSGVIYIARDHFMVEQEGFNYSIVSRFKDRVQKNLSINYWVVLQGLGDKLKKCNYRLSVGQHSTAALWLCLFISDNFVGFQPILRFLCNRPIDRKKFPLFSHFIRRSGG